MQQWNWCWRRGFRRRGAQKSMDTFCSLQRQMQTETPLIYRMMRGSKLEAAKALKMELQMATLKLRQPMLEWKQQQRHWFGSTTPDADVIRSYAITEEGVSQMSLRQMQSYVCKVTSFLDRAGQIQEEEIVEERKQTHYETYWLDLEMTQKSL